MWRKWWTVSSTLRKVSRSWSRTFSCSSSWEEVNASGSARRIDLLFSPKSFALSRSPRKPAFVMGVSPAMPVVMWPPGSSTTTSPHVSMVPVRNPMEERWPSPMHRVLITKRSIPGASPDWSGWTTADGLHSAAPSTANSCEKQAPMSRQRSSESGTWGSIRWVARWAWTSSHCRKSEWRCAKSSSTPASASRTSVSESDMMRLTTALVRLSVGPKSSWPATNSLTVIREGSGRRSTVVRRAIPGVSTP